MIRYFDAIMTDDTALYCEGLNQLPGPFIKWFLDTVGAKGIFDLVKDKPKKTTACCLLTLGFPRSHEIMQFKGEVEGELVAERGQTGFGWDGIFLPCSEVWRQLLRRESFWALPQKSWSMLLG